MFKLTGSKVAALAAAALLATLVMVGITKAGISTGAVMAFVGPIQLVLYVAFWAAVIAGGIWLARELGLIDGGSRRVRHDDAVAEVRRRYARGEITRTEYFQLLDDLEAGSRDRQRL